MLYPFDLPYVNVFFPTAIPSDLPYYHYAIHVDVVNNRAVWGSGDPVEDSLLNRDIEDEFRVFSVRFWPGQKDSIMPDPCWVPAVYWSGFVCSAPEVSGASTQLGL